MHLVLASLLAAILATGPAEQTVLNEGQEVRVVPVSRTPEPVNTALSIAVPKPGTTLNRNPVWIQFRMDGYPLGADSQFDRRDEIANGNIGQTVHVVIDNFPYIAVNEPVIDPFNEVGYFYSQSYKFELPFQLSPGLHIIRAFPARSFGESLKGEKSFATSFFYVGSEDSNKIPDFSKPFITYNQPSDQLYLEEGKPILLDFLLCNCELSPDGYKVRFSIDGKAVRTLTAWHPYYIYGLKKGKHTVRLELLDTEGTRVPGTFNDAKQTINVN